MEGISVEFFSKSLVKLHKHGSSKKVKKENSIDFWLNDKTNSNWCKNKTIINYFIGEATKFRMQSLLNSLEK